MRAVALVVLAAAFSPDEIEGVLDADLKAAEAPPAPPCDCAGTALLQTSLRAGGRARLPSGCDCSIEDSFKMPDAPEDGERLLVDQCDLQKQDIDFWELENTKFHPDGIVLDHTVGYSDSCDGCKKHNLKCLNEPTQIEPGYCLCMWRVDGADAQQSLLPCGECVTNCIGKVVQFDIAGWHQPELTNGLCIRKKGYTR